MTRPHNFLIVSISLLLLFATAVESLAQESAYPTFPVVAGAPEMVTHLDQNGLPSLGEQSWLKSPAASWPQLANGSWPGDDGGVVYPVTSKYSRTSLGHGVLKQGKVLKGAASPGIFGSADYLNLQLRRRDLDYAITSLPGAIVISGGEIHELEHSSAPAFRAILGYQWVNGWKLGVGYTTFGTTATGTAEDGAGTLYATRSHPDLNRRAGIADADSSFGLGIIDLEVRNAIHLGQRAELSLFGSFRWAQIGQHFSVTYDEIDFPVGGTVTSLTDSQAFGLRIGADGKWDVTDHIYLLGGAETSLLFSMTTISLQETNGSTTIVDVADSYEQVLPVLGARAAAGCQIGGLNVEMGYEMQAWFDLGDRMSFLDDQHLGVFAHSNHNVLMDGFYLRLGWDR